VVLGPEALQRAEELLESLDLGRRDGGGDRIYQRVFRPTPRPRADYEECSRLCRIL
jgi:hypothetical protein